MSMKAYFSKILFKTMLFAYVVLGWHIQCQQYFVLQAMHVNRQKQLEHRLVGSIYSIHKQVSSEPTKDTKEYNHE
jgi:hypothetical protein